MIPVEHEQELIVRRDLRVIDRIPLVGVPLTIGRSSRCNIRLDHPSVSREHAKLELRGRAWHLVDNKSTNGILVNGQRIDDAAIAAGDMVGIRPFVLEIVGGEDHQGEASIRLADYDDVHTAVRVSASPVGVAEQWLNELYALARLVIKREEVGAFWPSVQAALQRALRADRCVLIGLDDSGGLYRLAPAGAPSGGAEPLALSRSVVHEVAETRQSILVECVSEHRKYAQAASLAAGGTGSVICVPIVVSGRTRAIAYADRSRAAYPFSKDELEFTTAAVDLAAATAELDDLHESARQLARIQGHVEAGREIQKLLLPSPLPQPRWGEVAAVNLPAERMSGDIYDAVLDARGRLVVMLSDVAGKGVPAAFLTAILHNTLRLTLAEKESLADIVASLNASVHAYSAFGTFVTMVLCRWSSDGRVVEIANAGHPAPIWINKDGTSDVLPVGLGLPLGIDDVWAGRIVDYDATRATAVLTYSDGIIEARNPAEEEFEAIRLDQAFRGLAQQPAHVIVEALAEQVYKFCSPLEPGDDITMIIVKQNE